VVFGRVDRNDDQFARKKVHLFVSFQISDVFLIRIEDLMPDVLHRKEGV
jgi:hypothetical protein